MFRHIKNSLQGKLILMISLIVVLTGVAIGSFSFFKSSRAIEADVQRFSNQILKQAVLNLTRYINDNKQFYQSLASSQDIQDCAAAKPGDNYSNYMCIINIESHFINPYITYHPEVLTIMLYNENGNELIYRNGSLRETVISPEFSARSLVDKYGNAEAFHTVVSISRDYRNGTGLPIELPVLTYLQKLRYTDQSIYLAMDVSLQQTQNILDKIELGQNGLALITDSGGSIVSSPDYRQINTKLRQSIMEQMGVQPSGYVYDKTEEQMIVYQPIPETNDWQVMVFVPYNDLIRRIFDIRNWTIAMTGVSLLIAILLVWVVSHSITKRIKVLRRTIRMTKLGRFDIRSQVQGTDEVADLAEAYNLLLDRIDSSIHQLAESRLVQQRAILSALQSQINSHFLYNALESINSMANIVGHQQIRKSAVALSSMLRYTSNYTDSVVALKEELAHIGNYMQIVDNLYRDEIDFRIEADPEVLEAQCLKAIIQPFVENCIKHGYEVTGERMNICVIARRCDPEYIQLEIVDDGTGLTPDMLEKVQEELSRERSEQEFLQLTSIGILNVHYRLKTFFPYHSRTGIFVERVSENGGTRVCIIYPYKLKELPK